MEVLVLDGKNYVKASKAARDLGYATDYVGQLCRSNQVDAHLIGRTWYVNQEMLSTHKVEKKRISRVKAREHAKKTIEEHRLKVKEEINKPKTIDIQYESDTEALIPQTRKLSIVSTPQRIQTIDEEEKGENEVINAGDKVLMSGDIEVVDVTDGPIDTDTIILTPGRIKKTPPQPPQRNLAFTPEPVSSESSVEIHTEEESDIIEEEISEDTAENTVALPTFTERLQKLETVLPETEAVQPEPAPVIPQGRSIQQSVSFSWLPTLTAVFLCLIAFLSIGGSARYEYSASTPAEMNRSFAYSISESVTLLTNLFQK